MTINTCMMLNIGLTYHQYNIYTIILSTNRIVPIHHLCGLHRFFHLFSCYHNTPETIEQSTNGILRFTFVFVFPVSYPLCGICCE